MVCEKNEVNNRVVSLCLMNGVCVRVSSRAGWGKMGHLFSVFEL